MGFKNQRLPLPAAPPPDCPPMFLQIIREVCRVQCYRVRPWPLTPCVSPPAQCFHTDPSKRPRFEAVQRNLLIMVQQQQRR